MFADKKLFDAVKYYILFNSCVLSVIHSYNLNTDEAIVFSDPFKHSKNRGSYFGYSVALYSSPLYHNPSVLVGAPRANISGISVDEPGGVFKCSLDGNCNEWILDETKNGRVSKRLMYGEQNRNNSFLGGNLSVEDKENPRVLVCAPRWKLLIEGEQFMNGICYQSVATSSDLFEKPIENVIKSLTNYTEQTKKYKNGQNLKVFPHLAMGELGFSVHTFPDSKSEWNALLGSPGTYIWAGAPVLVSEHTLGVFESLVPSSIVSEYLGFSMTSGNYFGGQQRLFAAGCPRSDDMKGRVIIFTYDNYDSKVLIKNTVGGTQHGEYFSFAITTCDVDNNKQDDLIVGAPLWSDNGDEGRVYIFTAKNSKFLQLSSWIDGNVKDARFGSSVVCLGDIDRDGYNDVAVGAPYEEGHGAVYIFNGQSSGLSVKWSQRIAGNQFSHTLRSFGSSISEPRDIDGNGYKDIAIGAYESGHAVLLRTQPVVTVNIRFNNPYKVKLQSNTTSFIIEICCSYEGVNAPTYLKIIKKLTIDPVLGRASLKNLLLNNGTYDWFDTLYFSIGSCKKLQILLPKDIRNVIDPITISASLYLNPTQNEFKKLPNTFCATCPVLNKYFSKTEDFLSIPFAVDCGPDNICRSNITLNVSTSLGIDNRYIIGTSNIVNITVDVNNYAEPAYQSEVSIILPKYIDLAVFPKNCMEDAMHNGALEINCGVGKPLKKQKNFTIGIDMSQVNSDQHSIVIYIGMSTQSENINPNPPEYNLTIYFDVDVDITIAGKSHENMYSFINDKENDTIEPIRFEHIYEVQKFGATPIQQSTLRVLVPTQLISNKNNKIEIAKINDTSLSKLSLSAKLNSYCTLKTEESVEKSIYSEADFSIDTAYNISIPNIPSNERTLYLNCSNPSVICTTVFCSLISPLNSSTIAEVKITIDLLIKNDDDIMDGKDIIYFVSNGRANITLPDGIVQINDAKPDIFQVETTFVGIPVANHVATWIIALSVLLGIVLLILLTFGLIKLGFFNRKKKKELEALKADNDKKHGIVLETTSSTEILSEN